MFSVGLGNGDWLRVYPARCLSPFPRGLLCSLSASEMGTGSECTREVPVPISEADRVTLDQMKGTGTSPRSGARPFARPRVNMKQPRTPRS
jgi:hypothetical protein